MAQGDTGTIALVQRFPADSAVGALIAGQDWSASVLGPIEAWPAPLAEAVAMMLATPMPMRLFWGEHHVTLYNDAYADLIGARHPDTLGGHGAEKWRHVWDELGPLLERIHATGAPVGRRDEGMGISCEATAANVFDVCFSAIRDERGAIAGVLNILHDTTDRVRAMSVADAEHERLARMVEQAPSFMALLREPGHVFEFANAAYQRLIGGRPLLGLSVADALPEVVSQDFTELLDQVAATGQPYTGRNVAVTIARLPGGGTEERRIDVIFQPILDAKGLVSAVFVDGNDVTGRTRAEGELRESEGRFRSLADSAPALIWMCDADGQLMFANRWHEETFGRPVADLLGGGWQTVVHPADAASFCADFDAAFAARAPFSRDVRVIDRAGATRWLHSEARPRLFEGLFVGYVGCDIDITEAHLAAEALERGIVERTAELAAANRALSAQIEERERVEATLSQIQRLEAVGQLTSGVAHDFNNLLTVVLGNVDMIERQTSDSLDPRAAKRLGYVRAAAERGAALTAQLLAFSRRQRLAARATDLNEAVEGMRDLLRSTIGGSMRLETALQPDLWPALVDPTQLELIVLNLAINARDAMQVGGLLTVETDNVTLGAPLRHEEPAAGDYVMLAVADSGTGMTPEVLAKAFEPFFTTKEVGKGSGLGLPQVFGFARQSGGGVRIDTAPGAGTRISVYLPRADAVTLDTALDRSGEPSCDLVGRRVLLVDDDAPVREVAASMLRALGCAVTEAGSGGAALDQLERSGGAFDLLIADFAMPGMNGAELVKTAAKRWPAIPALFVTGFADLTAIADVSEDRIVQKPFRDDDLRRKICQLLAGM